ncbi:hypothetical protein PROFUN_12884 [Planoprotostelium fungivorum]|uniref:Uncharacterized protein n=1 Tax=Planoprotostelium fungivorum TaxID=1890364 RepID=A0A2P6MWI5_9EUKA|nr:hypothetical protein PROFUN_12884 [Planoprotostelium fungivorum]
MVSYISSVVSLFGLLLLMPIFCYVRKRWRNLYLPKLYTHHNDNIPREPRGYWEWIRLVLTLSEEQLLHSSGVDAALYLRSLKFCVVLLTIISVCNLVILVPTNRYVPGGHVTYPNNTSLNSVLIGFDEYTMINVPPGSRVMYIHLLSVFVYSALTLYCCNWLFQSLNLIERENSQYKYDTAVNRTVMIDKIPAAYCSDSQLQKVMERLYGSSVVHACVVPLVDDLDALTKQRSKYYEQYLDAMDLRREKPHLQPTHHIGFLGILGDEVETMPYLESKMAQLDGQISRIKQRRSWPTTNTGFVSFNSVGVAVQCSQTLLDRDHLKTQSAPYPGDINWFVFTKTRFEQFARELIMIALLAVLFVFWSIPVGIITAFSNLQALSQFHAADIIVWMAGQSDLIRSLLEGFLPTLGLSLFLVILPFVLKFIITLRNYLLNSEYDRMLMSAHWFFLVINVFLFSVATSTVLSFRYFWEVLGEPLELLNISELLATSLPSQALRFMNYIAFEGFSGFIDGFFAKTERQKIEAEKPPPFDFPIQYAREFFIFSMGLTYATITPFIVPFAALYFALAYISAKHNFIFLYSPNYKGRKVTQMVLDRILFSLFLYQVTMLGMFALKNFTPGAIVIVPTVCTPLFRWWLKKRYFKSSKYLPLMDCPAERSDLTEEELEETRQLYLHPALSDPPALRRMSQEAISPEEMNIPRQKDERGIIPPTSIVRRSNHDMGAGRSALSQSERDHPEADLGEENKDRQDQHEVEEGPCGIARRLGQSDEKTHDDEAGHLTRLIARHSKPNLLSDSKTCDSPLVHTRWQLRSPESVRNTSSQADRMPR